MRLLSFLRKASLGLSVLPATMVRGGSESGIRITRSYEVRRFTYFEEVLWPKFHTGHSFC